MGPSSQSKILFAVRSSGRNCVPSFGEKLRLEREKRAITLEQISLSTKIGTRMLQALEEDRFNQLPGGIFNKGFVRAYARCVGIDEDQAVADYLEASGEGLPLKPEPLAEEPIPMPEVRVETPSRPLPWGLFAALLLLVALALSVWSHRQRKQETQPAHSAPAAATETPQPTAPASTVNPAPVVSSDGTAAQNMETGAPPVQAERSSAGQARTLRPPAPDKATARPSSPGTGAAALPTSGFTVEIRLREESWISVSVDGKTVIASTLSAGSQRAVRGQKEVIVRAGNSGGVDFLFNGNSLARQGENGEAKTITFGPEGLRPTASVPPAVQ